jgi:hypothetical protein
MLVRKQAVQYVMQPTCIYSVVLTHAEHQLCLITSLNTDWDQSGD